VHINVVIKDTSRVLFPASLEVYVISEIQNLVIKGDCSTDISLTTGIIEFSLLPVFSEVHKEQS